MFVKRDVKNLYLHELIGLDVVVVESTNPNYIGKSGKVIDETKNTIVIDEMGKKKIIAKKGTVFEFYIDGKSVRVNGSDILFRPHERTKKLWKKRWLN